MRTANYNTFRLDKINWLLQFFFFLPSANQAGKKNALITSAFCLLNFGGKGPFSRVREGKLLPHTDIEGRYHSQANSYSPTWLKVMLCVDQPL